MGEAGTSPALLQSCCHQLSEIKESAALSLERGASSQDKRQRMAEYTQQVLGPRRIHVENVMLPVLGKVSTPFRKQLKHRKYLN